LLKVRRLS